MKKFFAKKQNNDFIFEGNEFNHFKVTRGFVGEEIICFGDDGQNYKCRVVEVGKKSATATILSSSKNLCNPKVKITVFQGLVKGEKMDLIVQKLTELGISDLYSFESEFTVAKANINKDERLAKISREACKQCGRNIPLNVHNAIKFEQMLTLLPSFDVVFFANEKHTQRDVSSIKKNQNIALVIGSEGGFSDNEIKKLEALGVETFGLGSRILRAETACIAMSAIIGYIVGV